MYVVCMTLEHMLFIWLRIIISVLVQDDVARRIAMQVENQGLCKSTVVQNEKKGSVPNSKVIVISPR